MALTLPCSDLLLRAFGYRQLLAWIERATPQAGSNPNARDGSKAGELLAQQAAIAGGRIPFFNTSCLRQSLAVYWQLRRIGFSPDLRIGIRPLRGQLDAHAWVELEGVALGQSRLAHQAFVADDDPRIADQPRS